MFASAWLCFTAVHADEPIVATKEGQPRGTQLQNPAVYVFKGVHYGQSTAGTARFKAPKRVAKWQGVKDAVKFGSICPQAAVTRASHDHER